MLRILRQAGVLGPLPWVFFAVVGGALLGAAAVIFLETSGGPLAFVGEIESLALLGGGVGLVAYGAVRRGRRTS